MGVSCGGVGCEFYRSTLGKKVVVAITGLMMIGFVVGHMLGNLKAFAGFDSSNVAALDNYAHHLRMLMADLVGEGNFLWLARGGLLGALVLHVVTVAQLTALNKSSRPVGYAKHSYKSSTVASRSMAYGGLILLLFIVFHILHFTTGHLHTDGFIHGQVYANVHSAFQHLWLVAVYTIAMSALGLHLFHGTWSVFQTLGFDNPDRNASLRMAATGLAVVVVLGFIAVPITMFMGLTPTPTFKSVTH
jgi:succinate dehydrogenase / fumarate reductase, cytochrome b subunit